MQKVAIQVSTFFLAYVPVSLEAFKVCVRPFLRNIFLAKNAVFAVLRDENCVPKR